MRFRPLLALALALVPVLACGSGGGASSAAGGSTSSSTGTGTNSCAGLGCAVFPGPLTLEVVDGMGAPVAGPQFAEQGHALTGVCETDAGVILQDAGACGSWVFMELSMGPHTITVSAPGYQPTTVSVTIQGPSGCCGEGPAVDRTVTLLPSPADAGTD
jgi:hypothetical protein